MSMHTYIGARYVPRFMGTYDATQQYEALDVVDNGSGTSYIARKIVPAGTPLTDTDHWFVYGASSGAIIALQNDMIQAQNDILGLQGDMTTAQSDITGLKAAVNRQLLVIGNSYVQLGGADQLKAIFDASYEKTYGGAGFSTYTGHSITFEDLIDDAIADASIPKSKITDILFLSAYGDTTAYQELGFSTYEGNLVATLGSIQSKISNNYPNVRKVSIALGESKNQAHFSDNKFNNMFKIHGMFKVYPSHYGMDYIGWPGFNILFVPSYFKADNAHLNSAGSFVLGNYLKAAYFGKLEYVTKTASSTTLPFAYTNSGTCLCEVSYTPDDTSFHIGQSTQGSSDAVTLVNNALLIDTYHSSLLYKCPPPGKPIVTDDPMYYVNGDGSVKEMLFLEITENATGEMAIKYYGTPSQATAGAAHLIIPTLHYSYKNY